MNGLVVMSSYNKIRNIKRILVIPKDIKINLAT